MTHIAISVEHHPLRPFLPSAARVLMLGSFPPKRERWSMEWFYPNWQNDMWRMPSTSRAYPLPLEKKAAFYRDMFGRVGLLDALSDTNNFD